MSAPRVHWHDLPEAIRVAVEFRTGPVLKSESVSAGHNSHVAAVLHTGAGEVFIKGMRSDHPRVWTQQVEADINPYVLTISPRILWHMDVDGWNMLGFEHVDGRHADLSPGSADLSKVAETIERLERISCPDLPFKRIEQRWADYGDEAALKLLSGDSLLHTDLSPHNILINNSGHVVDWAWPTAGAAWIDLACVALWLMAEGHTPQEAEKWTQRLPVWTTASDDAIDVFVVTASALWGQIARADPQPWKQQLAAAARKWARHRLR
jgi:hypothetical protein